MRCAVQQRIVDWDSMLASSARKGSLDPDELLLRGYMISFDAVRPFTAGASTGLTEPRRHPSMKMLASSALMVKMFLPQKTGGKNCKSEQVRIDR
jgi:hypothetical protein